MNIVINDWPKTIEEFKAMEIYDFRNPHNTVALFLIALDLFAQVLILDK